MRFFRPRSLSTLAFAALALSSGCNTILGIGMPNGIPDDARIDAPVDSPPSSTGVHVSGGVTTLGATPAAGGVHIVEQRIEAQQRVCTSTTPTTCVTAGITP